MRELVECRAYELGESLGVIRRPAVNDFRVTALESLFKQPAGFYFLGHRSELFNAAVSLDGFFERLDVGRLAEFLVRLI